MEQYKTTKQFLFNEVISLYSLCRTHRLAVSGMARDEVSEEMYKLEQIEDETCCSCHDKACNKEIEHQYNKIESQRKTFIENYNYEFRTLIHEKRDHIINNVLPNIKFNFNGDTHSDSKTEDHNKREAVFHFIHFIVYYFTCKQNHYSLGMNDYDIGFSLIESAILY